MRARGIWIAAVLTFSLARGVPAAAADGVLRVGTSGDYAPFSTWRPGQEGQLDGFDVAVARRFAADRGLRLELVPFRWPSLLDDLAAARFDVAMSGVTVRPERSVAGRFTAPVAETGAVVVVRTADRWEAVDDLDAPGVRIAVNAGGHLERVARARFPHADLVVIEGNAGVATALETGRVEAAVSEVFEAAVWIRDGIGAARMGPFTRDRKAYLVRADDADLAATLDTWLVAREEDGTLGGLRRSYLGAAAAPSASPLEALVAAIDERCALMELVAAAKRLSGRPLVDPERERLVLETSAATVVAAARRAGVTAPAPAAVAGFYEAVIGAAREVQTAAAPERSGGQAGAWDLERDLRPAVLRIGDRMARLLVLLPAGLERGPVEGSVAAGLRTAGVSAASRARIAGAIVALTVHAPSLPSPDPGSP